MNSKENSCPFSKEEIIRVLKIHRSDKFIQFVYSYLIGNKLINKIIKIILAVLFIIGFISLVLNYHIIGSTVTVLFFTLIISFSIIRLIALIRNNKRIVKISKLLKCSTREVEYYLENYI